MQNINPPAKPLFTLNILPPTSSLSKPNDQKQDIKLQFPLVTRPFSINITPSASSTSKTIFLDKLVGKVVSWNIDRLTADKWFDVQKYLTTYNPLVMCLNEIKQSATILTELFNQATNYTTIINDHLPAHYHGVAMMIRKDVAFKQLDVKMELKARSDSKDSNPTRGRLIAVELTGAELSSALTKLNGVTGAESTTKAKINIVSTYTPNAGTALKYLDYRMQWDEAFLKLLKSFNQPTIWLGDINVAKDVIDVSNPDMMNGWSGFTPQERNNLDKCLQCGWIDIWRKKNPNKKMYSWIGVLKKGSVPDGSFGMRLDSVIISNNMEKHVTDSFIDNTNKVISDHLLVGVDISV